MKEITAALLTEALEELGVKTGDRLLVHSAIQFLGKPAGGAGMYYQVLARLLGIDQTPPAGTMAVPAFNFGFARGERFDPDSTPSIGMGVFSEFVRQQPGVLRTCHPMQSLVVVGKDAKDLAGRDTPSAFDPGSALDRMLELDFHLLLLGADIQAASIFHYSEQRAQVPYRYWKDFSGQVKHNNAWEMRTYRMFVRDLDLDPRLEVHTIMKAMVRQGQWRSKAVNYGFLHLCSLRDFVRTADDFLARDPWIFVTNRPENTPHPGEH